MSVYLYVYKNVIELKKKIFLKKKLNVNNFFFYFIFYNSFLYSIYIYCFHW